MSNDRYRKLTPLQMEQFIIHLKSEIDKYKNKTDEYKKVVQKSKIQEIKEKNEDLEDEIEQLKSQLREQEQSNHSLKLKNDKLQSEVLGYQIHISELKNHFESDILDLKEQIQSLNETEDQLQKELAELRKLQNELAELRKLENELAELKTLKNGLGELETLLIEKKAGRQQQRNQYKIEALLEDEKEESDYLPIQTVAIPLKESNWVQRQLNTIACSPLPRSTNKPTVHTTLQPFSVTGKVDPFRHLRK